METLTKRVKSNFRNKLKRNRTSTTKQKSSQDILKNQINNYETRLKTAGYDTEQLKDTRNPIEKFLNLRPNQNVLFDIFELLNRPQQALFGAIDSAQKGKDAGKGALQGLTGKKYTTGGKLLRNAGMEGNGKGNIFTKEGRKNLSASDFLGFGLDLFADPMDYLLLPVKATATAGKAVKAADTASDVLKGSKLVKTADTIGDTARGISKATATLDTLGNVGKTSKYVWKPANAALINYAAQGIKGTAKLGDKAITKMLNVSDARNLGKATKRAAKTGDTIENVARELGVSTNKAGVYQALKDRLGRLGNSSKNLDGLIGKSREAQNIKNITEEVGRKTMASIDDDVAKIVNRTVKNADDVEKETKKIYDAIATKIQAQYKYRDITGADVLERLKKGKQADFFKDTYAKKVLNELDKYGVKAERQGRYITLLDEQSKLKPLSEAIGSKKFGKFWSEADERALKSANWTINNTEGLREVYEKANNATRNMGRFEDSLTGLNVRNISDKEGYLKETLTKEGRELPHSGTRSTASKSFKGRTFKGTPQEYNRLVNERVLANQNDLVANPLQEGTKITKRGENAAKSIYKMDDEGNFIRKNGELIRDDNLQKSLIETKKARIDKLNNELVSSKEILKGKTKGLDAINESKLTPKGARQLNTLKAEKEYRETVEKLKKIKYDNITPEASDSIDNLRKSFKNYRKSKTAYTNELKRRIPTTGELNNLKKNIGNRQKLITEGNTFNQYKKAKEAYESALKTKGTSKEVLGNLKKTMLEKQKLVRDSKTFKSYEKSKSVYDKAMELSSNSPNRLNKLREDMVRNQKIVTNNIDVAKAFQNKQSRDIIKNGNKAFREGKSLGASIAREIAKSKKATAQMNEIYQAAADMADSIPKQLKYQQAALNKIENSADAIFNSKTQLIKKQAEAANILASKEGMEYMNTAFNTNFMDFVNQSSELSRSASVYNEALKTGIFTNKKYVKFVDDLADSSKVPYGFTKVNGDTIASKLGGDVRGVLPEGMKEGADAVANYLKGKTLIMDNDLINILRAGQNAASKEAHPLVKFFNGINNTFKKFATLTPGFQIRNIIGNGTNMVLSGVPASSLPVYYGKAAELWNNADNLITKAKEGIELTAKESKQFETLKDFYKAGFARAFEEGNALEDIMKGSKGITGRLSKASVKANEFIDNYNRLALLMYAKDHPKYLEKLGRSNAVDAVRMVLFDPSNMSDIEKTFMKKAIPFYTFTKQNLMFQMENIMRNTPKYAKLFRAYNKAYDSVGEDNYYDYQKENFQVPIWLPFLDNTNGNQLFLKSNLPISDLGEFASNPIRRTLASTTPVLRTPIELVTGKSLFTGQDANYTVLKKTLNKLGIDNKTANDSAKVAETVLNSLGLQNVSTNLIRKVQTVLEKDTNDTSPQQLWSEIFRSVLQNTKRENIVNSGLYDELEQYQAIIKRLKNQGVNIPTMTEINATNKMKLNRLKRKRAYSR